MEMSFEKTGEKWVVFCDLDYCPVPEVNIFETEEEAIDYFKDVVQDDFDKDDTDKDYDGNSLEDCVENGMANLGGMRVMILAGDTVRRRF